jgi:hypothetical protein
MAEIIQGNATTQSPTTGAKTRVAISATSNATPVQVTTKTVHGFFTGDSVEIEGTGIVTVDGLFIVTVIDTLNFTLNGSTAPGSTSSSGYCVDYAVQPALQIPDPGDTASMVTMGPIIQGLLDNTPSAYRRAGKYRLYNYLAGLLPASPATGADPYSASWSATAVFSAGDNFLNLSGVSLDFLANGFPGSAGGPVVVNGTDVLEVSYEFSVQLVSSVAVNTTFHLVAFPGKQADFHQVTLTSATTPVQVTTSTAHGLSTNDFAGIFNCGSNSLDNLWKITRIDNFNYTLNGSTSPGVTTAGATAVSIPSANRANLRPSNWPLIGVPTAGIYTPMVVRGILGSPLIPLSNAPFSPSALYWFGLYTTPDDNTHLSQANLIGPAMCTVRHFRVN